MKCYFTVRISSNHFEEPTFYIPTKMNPCTLPPNLLFQKTKHQSTKQQPLPPPILTCLTKSSKVTSCSFLFTYVHLLTLTKPIPHFNFHLGDRSREQIHEQRGSSISSEDLSHLYTPQQWIARLIFIKQY